MNVVLLIDGYNVIAPVGPPRRGAADWLARERAMLVERLATWLPPPVAHRTCVVFDAKDRPVAGVARWTQAGIDVQFAVEHPEADDLIEEIIESHANPRQLTVISSDRRLQLAVKRRGGGFYDSQRWLDRLLAGRLDLVHEPKKMPPVSDVPGGVSGGAPDGIPGVPGVPGVPAADEVQLPDDASIDLFLREFGDRS